MRQAGAQSLTFSPSDTFETNDIVVDIFDCVSVCPCPCPFLSNDLLPPRDVYSSSPGASVDWVRIGSDNGLSPVRRQAITSTSPDLLSIGPLGTNFSEIWIKTQNFNSRKCIWKYRLRNGVHFVQGEMLGRFQILYSNRPCHDPNHIEYHGLHICFHFPWGLQFCALFWYAKTRWPPFRRRYFQMHFRE